MDPQKPITTSEVKTETTTTTSETWHPNIETIKQFADRMERKALPEPVSNALTRFLLSLNVPTVWAAFIVALLGFAFDYWTGSNIARGVGRAVGIVRAEPAPAPEPIISDLVLSVTGSGVKTVTIVNVPFVVSAPAGSAYYAWQIPVGVTANRRLEKIEVSAAPKGELTFSVDAVTVDFDAKKVVTKTGTVTVTSGTDPPKPVDPVKPPPVKPVDELIPKGSLRVLFLEESGNRSFDLGTALASPALKNYLDATCAKVNNQPEYRVFDDDSQMDKVSKVWQDAVSRAKANPAFVSPWLAVFNGNTPKFEGPVPTVKADELLSFIKKYVKE